MKRCKYCNIKNGAGEIINNNGDEFNIMHEQGEKYQIACNKRNYLYMLNIKYCPMCGRRLKKGDSELPTSKTEVQKMKTIDKNTYLARLEAANEFAERLLVLLRALNLEHTPDGISNDELEDLFKKIDELDKFINDLNGDAETSDNDKLLNDAIKRHQDMLVYYDAMGCKDEVMIQERYIGWLAELQRYRAKLVKLGGEENEAD